MLSAIYVKLILEILYKNIKLFLVPISFHLIFYQFIFFLSALVD